MAAKQSKQTLETSKKQYEFLAPQLAELKNKVNMIPQRNQKLLNELKFQNWKIEDRPQDEEIKNLRAEKEKIDLKRSKNVLQQEEKAIKIGDWTLDNITKWYKFNRDDGYSKIATGYSNGQFIFGSNKATEINKVKQNAFASIFQKIREAEGETEDGGKRLYAEKILGNADVIANLNVIAQNIEPITPDDTTVPELGKIYLDANNKKYIYLGLGGNFSEIRLLPN